MIRRGADSAARLGATGLVALAALVGLGACQHGVPLRADDPTWFASVHAERSDRDVRDTIDELLERDAEWSRGPHGLVRQSESGREGIPCRKIHPESFQVACDDEGACQVDLELTDRAFGEDVSLTGVDESEAQLLAAMMLRFCGFREPGAGAAGDESPEPGS